MGDLISRKALLEELDKWINPCANREAEFLSGIATAISEVETAPTVDAAPVVHGEWIGYETSSYNGNDEYEEPRWIPKKFFRCSICRKGTAVRHNFCPNCGAKMDGGNDDENFSSLRRIAGGDD